MDRLASRKGVSTAMFTDLVRPLHCHRRHHQQPQWCTRPESQTDQQLQLLPHHHH